MSRITVRPRLRLRYLTAAVAALLVATVAVAVEAPSAGASAGCYSTGCTGWDPIARGCTATSTTTNGGPLGTVWNRYSAGCDANWARGQLSAAAVAAGYQMQVTIITRDRNGNMEAACMPDPDHNNVGATYELCSNWYGGPSTLYTDMVDGTNLTYAYVTVVDAWGDPLASYEADQ